MVHPTTTCSDFPSNIPGSFVTSRMLTIYSRHARARNSHGVSETYHFLQDHLQVLNLTGKKILLLNGSEADRCVIILMIDGLIH